MFAVGAPAGANNRINAGLIWLANQFSSHEKAVLVALACWQVRGAIYAAAYAAAHAATPAACALRSTRPGLLVAKPSFMPSATAMLWLAPKAHLRLCVKISRTKLASKPWSRDHWATLKPWCDNQMRASVWVRSFFMF